MKFGTRVKQSQPFNRKYFHDNRCPIFDFMRFWSFLKNGRGRSNFRKIPAIVLKQHRNILYRSRNFGIKFGQNRLKSWKSDTHCSVRLCIMPRISEYRPNTSDWSQLGVRDRAAELSSVIRFLSLALSVRRHYMVS